MLQDLDVANLNPVQASIVRGATAPSSPVRETSGLNDAVETICSHAEARRLLRNPQLRQAGFDAERVARLPLKNKSILFAHGDAHRRQRSAVARLFAPATIPKYRGTIVAVSRRLIEQVRATGGGAVDDLSLELTTAVAAEIVGLAPTRGLAARLGRFFDETRGEGALATIAYLARSAFDLAHFFLRDVRPAIRAREREPRNDLVSHLLAMGASRLDILTECVTYAAAGISTTREFITYAACTLLDRADLRAAFLAGDDVEKRAVLNELLRLEPVVGTIARHVPTPDGDRRVVVDIGRANRDEGVFACPHQVTLGATWPTRHLSFGDGPHRCPGEFIALLEVAIFLDELLRVPGLRLAARPIRTRNEKVAGYVLRGARIEV